MPHPTNEAGRHSNGPRSGVGQSRRTTSQRPESKPTTIGDIDAEAFAPLGTIIFVLPLASPSWAQKPPVPAEADQANPPYPGESHITFQWNYSCPGGHACSFRCPGAGGATSVTTLDIYLGVMPTGSDQHGLALFYNFVTQNIPRGNGFSVSNGTAILSCQVNGMRLDYSGPPK
jgi:hypothetical protein